MPSVRWGVLSTARIGTGRVIRPMQAASRCEVAAISSRDPERARVVAGQMGIPRWHGSYEALLADPEVDAVYNPLPNHLHAEWTVAALEAGKHVLCEKPIGLSAAEARVMDQAARKTGRLLMEGFMYRLHPTWQAARRLLASGHIGALRGVQSWFSFYARDPSDIRNLAACGGGAMLDIGCYCVNLSRMLMSGEPTEVAAQVTRDASGIDTTAAAVLGFGDRLASFGVSIRAESDQRVVIYGTEGRIQLEVPFNIPGDRATRILVWRGSALPSDPPEIRQFPPSNMYTLQAEAFADSVLDSTPLPFPAADAVGNMEVIDRILGAARVRPS